MAKKKDNTDEEWFEDDDEEESVKEKPKKKGGKKKKNLTKVAIWAGIFIVILLLLIFIRYKYSNSSEVTDLEEEENAPEDEIEEVIVKETDQAKTKTKTDSVDSTDNYKYATDYEYDPSGEPKVAPGPHVIPKEDLPKVEEVIDTTIEPQLFSNIRCDYDYYSGLLYMSLRIYNTLEEDIKISPRGVQKGYNTYFLIRGVVDTDPGCGTELVHSNEWTDCKRIGFDLKRYANVPGINRISVQVPGKTEALLVECPQIPQDTFEEEE